jgi:hypothetical protein
MLLSSYLVWAIVAAVMLVLVAVNWRRVEFYFSRSSRLIAFFSGFALEIFALARWSDWQPLSSIFAGVGGSVLAAVLIGFLSSDADKAYQMFLRSGVTRFYPNREQSGIDWIAKLRETKHQSTLLGQALGRWSNDRNFRSTLVDRVQAGVSVEFYFLNPEGNAAKVRANEDKKNIEPLVRRTKASIKEVWKIRSELEDPKCRERLKLYVYDATPSLGLNWFDKTMFATHYLGGMTNLTSPLLQVEDRPGPDTLYAVYHENVKAIQALSTPITDANVREYTEGPDVQT